eukprot:GHVU01217193.1.p3 GENE.GHVU01217193.1~~GHVU01217193.1.p3  ORF type:complete len:131 (-),score=23.42 GHVU01217193.1:1311-1703(-)
MREPQVMGDVCCPTSDWQGCAVVAVLLCSADPHEWGVRERDGRVLGVAARLERVGMVGGETTGGIVGREEGGTAGEKLEGEGGRTEGIGSQQVVLQELEAGEGGEKEDGDPVPFHSFVAYRQTAKAATKA